MRNGKDLDIPKKEIPGEEMAGKGTETENLGDVWNILQESHYVQPQPGHRTAHRSDIIEGSWFRNLQSHLEGKLIKRRQDKPRTSASDS